MAQRARLALAAITCLGGCASPPPAPQPATPVASTAPLVKPTLEAYKQRVARRIAQVSGAPKAAPLPEVFKSIVVLQITVNPRGQPVHVAVLRSNDYAHLTQRALASVNNAAPFDAPEPALLQEGGSLSFLETFLFRDDDSFQLRSLVAQ